MEDPIFSEQKRSAQVVTHAEVQQGRLQLLNGLMLTTFFIAGPYLTIFVLDVSQTMPESIGVIAMSFIAMYIIIGVNTFVRRIPYLARTIILLMTLYGLAIYDMCVYGLISDGRIYSVSMVIVAALLLGIASATVIAGLVVASLAALGGLVHHWVPTPISSGPNVLFWMTQLTSQAVHSIILLVCIAFLLRRLVDALSSSRTALQQAEASAQEAQRQSGALAAQTKLLEEAQHQLQDLVTSLETPAVDVADRIVLAPITGMFDARRAHAFTDHLLRKAHTTGTRLVILDLAGMPTADPAGIHALKMATQALGLLGCQVVFTSLSATLTLSFVQAGFQESALEFRRSPQEVLEAHFARTYM